MRYIIYGAGGVGGAIGARLFQHGHETVFICRGEHHAVLQRRGLTFKTPNETLQLRVRTVGHPAELKFTKNDTVILTMKSHDTESALRDLIRVGGSDVAIVCAQNGVDNERLAARPTHSSSQTKDAALPLHLPLRLHAVAPISCSASASAVRWPVRL